MIFSFIRSEEIPEAFSRIAKPSRTPMWRHSHSNFMVLGLPLQRKMQILNI